MVHFRFLATLSRNASPFWFLPEPSASTSCNPQEKDLGSESGTVVPSFFFTVIIAMCPSLRKQGRFAGCPDHLADAILIGGAEAALAASIFHFGDHTVREAKELMAKHGIPVRL